MTRNLDTADAIVKMVLAIATIVLFMTKVIAGPSAVFLTVLSVMILAIHGARLVIRKLPDTREKQMKSGKNVKDEGHPRG